MFVQYEACKHALEDLFTILARIGRDPVLFSFYLLNIRFYRHRLTNPHRFKELDIRCAEHHMGVIDRNHGRIVRGPENESAMNEAGDLLIPIAEGAIDERHILGEIGEVLAGNVAGRTGDPDITLYKSLGIVAQDLFAAAHVYARAVAEGAGVEVDLG